MVDRPKRDDVSSVPHPATIPPEELLLQCDERRGRESGPGGQHRNKVETAVTLTHRPTGVHGHASERRSHFDNHRMAIRRLRVNLALEVRRPVDPMARASELWKSRVRKGRISLNPEHVDFAPMLAEAMDMLATTSWDPARAAAALMCTTSQLVRMLKDEPRAIERLNEERKRRGLRAYK